jgi:FdhE protein
MVPLEQRLRLLCADYPELAADLSSEASLLRTVLQTPQTPHTPLPPLPRERLAARLAAGMPMLHDQPLVIDLGFAMDLLRRLVRTMVDTGDDRTGVEAEAVLAVVVDGRLDAEQVFVEAFVQHPDHLAQLAVGSAVEPTTLRHLVELAVAPIRRRYASALANVLNQPGRTAMGAWREGYCPVCGSWPIAGDAEPHGPSRSLRCGACGTSWRLRHRRCPFCGTNDPRRAEILGLDWSTGPLVGVQVCKVCGRYLKLADALDAIPSVLLGFEDLGSRALDDASSLRGFQRPAGAGFTLELALPEPGWGDALAMLDVD